ncbi:MAG: hypothetical protein MAG715_00915 [Methanonatronarchaeales archaeon]|nr:hypothetical protein [Methanonatronarchaeales archaeon]
MDPDRERVNVLVTGATGGVGPAVTDRLVERGAEVAGTYRDENELEDAMQRTENSYDVYYHHVELTDEEQVRELRRSVERDQGTLDGIVDLVGGFSPGRLGETGRDDFRDALDTHATTVFLVLRSFYDHLEESGGAAVNFSSKNALDSQSGALAYNAGKMAVASVTACVDSECRNARVNAVAPATIDTPANREATPDADFDQWTSLEQVADVVEFLLDDRSKAVRGEIIAI